MRCPRDAHPMQESRLLRVIADVCPYCDGCFLDPGELAVLRRGSDDLRPGEVVAASGEASVACPRCQVSMEARRFSSTGVVIDVCPTCQGLWLDGSELKTIVSEGRQG